MARAGADVLAPGPRPRPRRGAPSVLALSSQVPSADSPPPPHPDPWHQPARTGPPLYRTLVSRFGRMLRQLRTYAQYFADTRSTRPQPGGRARRRHAEPPSLSRASPRGAGGGPAESSCARDPTLPSSETRRKARPKRMSGRTEDTQRVWSPTSTAPQIAPVLESHLRLGGSPGSEDPEEAAPPVARMEGKAGLVTLPRTASTKCDAPAPWDRLPAISSPAAHVGRGEGRGRQAAFIPKTGFPAASPWGGHVAGEPPWEPRFAADPAGQG